MKNKFLLTIDDLKSIRGGESGGPNPRGIDCGICTCTCTEINVAGFQVGMSINVSQGQINNPCTVFTGKSN